MLQYKRLPGELTMLRSVGSFLAYFITLGLVVLPVHSQTTSIRIVSGANARIQLDEKKSIIYLVPVNYEVQEEKLGFISDRDKPQGHEIVQEFTIERVGTAVLAQAGNAQDLYPSVFVSGWLPSSCHRLAVETKSEEAAIHVLIYAAIDRKKVCVRKPEQTAAAMVIPSKLPLDRPIALTINYQPVAQLKSGEGTLEMITQGRQWRITRLSEIIEKGEWNSGWLKEWTEGKPIKPK